MIDPEHGARGGTAGSDEPSLDRDIDASSRGRDTPEPSRDRDVRGRARNARPRDATGRPLPRDAVGVEPTPDEPTLGPAESIAEAQRLLDTDRPFAAHEVLEAAWKAAPDVERELWRGLAQLAVGLTHVQRGNARGAAALLTRAGERIGSWIGPAPYGLDLDGLAERAGELAERISQGGVAAASPAQLRPRLRSDRPAGI